MKPFSRFKATFIVVVSGLLLFFGTLFFDIDLFEKILGFFKSVELYELDEIFLLIFLISIGVAIDLCQIKRKKKQRQEIEKQRLLVLKSTMTTVHNIVNNFLNSLQLFRMEAEKTQALEQGTLKLFDSLIRDTSDKLKALGDLDVIPEKHIGGGICDRY